MTVLHQDIGDVSGLPCTSPREAQGWARRMRSGRLSVVGFTLVGMAKLEHTTRERRDWVNTISLEHVRRGVEGGFTQADHGKSTRLSRLQAGDRIVFYSPRTDYPDGEPLQQFTACGVITGAEVYQVELTPDLHPWRRAVTFVASTPVPIRPLLSELTFIPDERNWGFTFRRGLFQVPSVDFDRIAGAMDARFTLAEGAARTSAR